MELVSGVIGPLQTNVHLVADPRTREAIVVDTAIPGLPWITGELAARGWRLLLIVSTHGHWDHTGENAALQAWTSDAGRPRPRLPPRPAGPPAPRRSTRWRRTPRSTGSSSWRPTGASAGPIPPAAPR